jgi:exosortase
MFARVHRPKSNRALISETSLATATPKLGLGRKSRVWIIWLAILSALVVALYGPVFKTLVLQWWKDPDYGHGFLVPLFSVFVLWREREQVQIKTKIQPSNFGFLVMIVAVAMFLAGSLGAEVFTSRFSLLVLLAGMILFLAGWQMLRAVSFPLAFLTFMIPIPAILYNQMTFPLQLLASRFATVWLEFVGVPALREGNILILPNYSLEVVEACSGIRSLMTLITLSIAYGHLIERHRWVRYALTVLMVPIAIVSNAIRIMGTGVLTYHFGPAAAEGFFHEFSGWIIFLVALVLLLICHWILKRIDRSQRPTAHV